MNPYASNEQTKCRTIILTCIANRDTSESSKDASAYCAYQIWMLPLPAAAKTRTGMNHVVDLECEKWHHLMLQYLG